MSIFGNKIYILNDDQLPQTMQEIGSELSKIKSSSKDTSIPNVKAQFKITNKDQSVVANYEWGMQFEYARYMASDDLFRADVKYMKSIVNIEDKNKQIVIFDGEWNAGNPKAAKIMTESSELLFDLDRTELSEVFVDPR